MQLLRTLTMISELLNLQKNKGCCKTPEKVSNNPCCLIQLLKASEHALDAKNVAV